MTTALLSHDDCLGHLMPSGHPERPARLEHVKKALAGRELTREAAPLARDADLLLCHPQSYIDRLTRAAPDRDLAQLDGDTYLSPGTLAAARRGAGGAIRAVDMVLAGTAANAFVATRPPGHHAETATPMGFCLFGNAALAARHALERHGLSRVAVVDFDVHHGNGTQDLLWSEARTLFVSSHQMPLWPGTGAAAERGAHGNVLNVPLAPGTDGATFRTAYEAQVLPVVDGFAPELLIVSAGFDAHRDDPLANLDLQEADFAWVTEALAGLARRHCGGRLVSCLEGGYDLGALAGGVRAHVDALIAAGRG